MGHKTKMGHFSMLAHKWVDVWNGTGRRVTPKYRNGSRGQMIRDGPPQHLGRGHMRARNRPPDDPGRVTTAPGTGHQNIEMGHMRARNGPPDDPGRATTVPGTGHQNIEMGHEGR